MRETFWNKKIPTLLGLLIITIAISITTLLVGQSTFFEQQASPTTEPQDVRITNISDSSFTVSYKTSSFVLGSVNFGKDHKLGQTVGDERDKNTVAQHKIHSFTTQNLDPSTKYYFSIVSGQESYLNNGLPYEVTTAAAAKTKGGTGFMVGKVVTVENLPPKEAVVYMTTTGAQALSTVANSDGSYTLSLEKLRQQDLSSFFSFKPQSTIKMLIVSDVGQSSVVLTAKEVNYVPTVVISKNYDFTQSASETATSSAELSFPTISTGNVVSTPQITTPTKDQNLSDQTPLFKGKGVPNDKIIILIESEPIQGQVTVDSSGNWSFTPTTPLAPGLHTITITARDSAGILRTITQTFTIVGAAQAATPTPTPTPSLFPTPTPTAAPIVSASPSATPIVIPTPTPAPIVIATPIPTLPPTGTSEVSTGVMGMALAVVGVFFFLLTRVLL